MYTGTGTVPVQYPGTVYYFKKHVATQALVPSTQSVITTLTTGTYVPPSLYLFQFSGTGTSTAPPRYVWYTCTPLCLFFPPLILMIRRTYEDRTQNPFFALFPALHRRVVRYGSLIVRHTDLNKQPSDHRVNYTKRTGSV